MLKPLADEVLEYATASTVSGLSVAPFQPFNAGDIVRLQSYVQFRVTTTGRIGPNTYRMRSFSAIGVSQGNNGCGYGLGPYGLTPYGCGLDIAQGPPPPPPDPYSLSMTGNLILGGESAMALPAPAVGIWVSSSDDFVNSFTTLPFTQYRGIDGVVNLLNPDVTSVQWVALSNGQILSITASMTGNPIFGITMPSTNTCSVSININGITQNGIVATIVGGQRYGTGTGVINFQQGDKLAIVITVTGTYSSNFVIPTVMIAYKTY